MSDANNGSSMLHRIELISIGTLLTATAFALVAIACRISVYDQGGGVFQGQGLELLLVTAGWLSACLLIGRTGARHWIEKTGRVTFALFAVIALAAWAPGFAFGLLVVSPVIGAIAGPRILGLTGYCFGLQPLANSNANVETNADQPTVQTGRSVVLQNETDAVRQASETPLETGLNSPSRDQLPDSAGLLVQPDSFASPPQQVESSDQSQTQTQTQTQTPNPMESLGQATQVAPMFSASSTTDVNADQDSEASDEEAGDVWSMVQQQFISDQELIQNVTQWRQADGTRCLVANLRCHFSTADETCIVQLPFWPILDQAPEVFCRVAHGVEGTVKTTRELPHGLRLEVRLNDRSPAAEAKLPTDLIVEVVATAESMDSQLDRSSQFAA